MEREDLLQKLKKYIEEGETLTLEIYDIGNKIIYEAYRLRCKDITVLGSLKNCALVVYVNNKEVYEADFLKIHKKRKKAEQELMHFFIDILIDLEKRFENEGKKVIVEDEERNMVISDDVILRNVITLKLMA